jgi:type I thyroxine 5'-deiodinase
VRQEVVFDTPKNDAERTSIAQACVRKLGIEIPAVVDTVENRVEAAYTGWPDRIYVIGREGKVAFKTAPGPFGFDVKRAEQALKDLLASGSGR